MNKKRIHFFKDFREAAEAEQEYRSEISPLERLARTVELIKQVYQYKPGKYYRIFFEKS